METVRHRQRHRRIRVHVHDLARCEDSYGIDLPWLLPAALAITIASATDGLANDVVWPFLGAAAALVCLGFSLSMSLHGKFIAPSDRD